MLILQILIVPFVVLLLLGAIFVIGIAGVEQPKHSTGIDRDVACIDEPNPTWTTDSIRLPYQSQSFKKPGLEQVNMRQTEIIFSNPACESLSELPIYIL